MSLTPEQWRDLDEWERRLAATKAEISAAIAAGHVPLPASPLDNAAANQSFWFDVLLRRHARALIDAARPKCPKCNGERMVKRMRPGLTRISGGEYVHVEECPDCIDHPGWAA